MDPEARERGEAGVRRTMAIPKWIRWIWINSKPGDRFDAFFDAIWNLTYQDCNNVTAFTSFNSGGSLVDIALFLEDLKKLDSVVSDTEISGDPGSRLGAVPCQIKRMGFHRSGKANYF